MAGRQMEGDNRQRRAKAREARRRGRLASEEAATTGASKQRHHLRGDEEHVDKIAALRRGKQEVIRQKSPEPKPRSRPPGVPPEERWF